MSDDPRLATWDLKAMWHQVESVNPRIRGNALAKRFITQWIAEAIASSGRDAAGSQKMRRLVDARERSIKLGQSRLTNDKLLSEWSGRSGSERLTYRWQQVRRILLDIHAGLRVDHAGA